MNLLLDYQMIICFGCLILTFCFILQPYLRSTRLLHHLLIDPHFHLLPTRFLIPHIISHPLHLLLHVVVVVVVVVVVDLFAGFLANSDNTHIPQ